MIDKARGDMMARVSSFEDGSRAWPSSNQSIQMDDRVISDLVSGMVEALAIRSQQGDRSRRQRRRRRVFYAIFAGRRHFMALHLKWTDLMLRQGLVNEVHLWDFCSVTEDSEYLAAFARDTSV